jgi:hypothetical protein
MNPSLYGFWRAGALASVFGTVLMAGTTLAREPGGASFGNIRLVWDAVSTVRVAGGVAVTENHDRGTIPLSFDDVGNGFAGVGHWSSHMSVRVRNFHLKKTFQVTERVKGRIKRSELGIPTLIEFQHWERIVDGKQVPQDTRLSHISLVNSATCEITIEKPIAGGRHKQVGTITLGLPGDCWRMLYLLQEARALHRAFVDVKPKPGESWGDYEQRIESHATDLQVEVAPIHTGEGKLSCKCPGYGIDLDHPLQLFHGVEGVQRADLPAAALTAIVEAARNYTVPNTDANVTTWREAESEYFQDLIERFEKSIADDCSAWSAALR